MQSSRSLSRLPISNRFKQFSKSRRAFLTSPKRNMSFFPRTLASTTDPSSFHPLFRLLEDFDSYNRGSPTNNGQPSNHRGGVMKSFTPKFDVKEVGDSYQLYGELPGVDQSNIDIEFTDAQTLQIKGRTERSYTSGTPPAGFLEPSKTAGTITEANKESSAHQPTVEDEDAAKDSQVAKKDEKPVEKPAEQAQEKYWVSERSVGEFSRSFTFPVRVDSEHVQASMKNGVLNIVVPKAKKDQARKITIS